MRGIIAIWLAVLIGVIVSGIFVGDMCKKAEDNALTGLQPVISARQDEITVTFINSTYESVAEEPAGWFTSGQDADIMVSGIDFNNTGGPLLFNHQGNVATDGTHLLLADRNNNRVLIWESLPTENSPPDIVLGQENFYGNNPGTGLNHMSWPVSAATDGQHVVVADTYNDRVLIWNNFPTQNGTSADFELKEGIGWPWAVWTNGTKLVVASTACRAVLIWNTFPTSNTPADISLTSPNFGTPRAIASDGNHLVIGDHNAVVNGTQQQGNFFWKTFPTQNNQSYDFFVAEVSMMGQPTPPQTLGSILWGTMTSDGKLIGVGNQLYIWNSFPENKDDAPDLSVGAGFPGASGYDFGGSQSGDGSGAVVAGGRLYISLSNGNKIVVYNSIPITSTKNPDFAVGSPDIYTNTLKSNYFITNPGPVSDGKSLFVSSDFDRKLYVWKQLPDESGAKPDIIYNLSWGPWANALLGSTLVLAGGNFVYVWNTLPLNGELPDLRFMGSIGNVTFQDLRGVALDNKYFYLADKTANKIYVWEGIPNDNTTNAKFSIDISMPTRLSSDGTYLVATATEAAFNEKIKFYRIDELSSSTQPTNLIGVSVNLPEYALAASGHLFIADTCFNRVLVWNNISDAVNGSHPDIVLGEEDFEDTQPEIGVDKLFWPARLTFDGSYLWVGEYKFSCRVVRFSVKPVSHAPIYIDGNSNFTSTNGVVSGNGTETKPYIIEGWDINASSANGIDIRNTDKYFIMRNCVIHDGSSNYRGIYFNSVRNGKIDNVTSHNNSYGIYLYYSSNDNIITNCSVYNNYYYGLYLYYSSNNTLTGNTFTNDGVVIWGDYLEQYTHNISTSNTVNGKPLYYYKNQNDLVIDNIAIGQLILVNCTNCNIKNLDITNTDVGIELAYSSNNIIASCDVYNDSYGIYLCCSLNNKITNCVVYNNSDCGFHLYSSSNNDITNCVVYNNSYEGIRLGYSSNNTITNCTTYNNSYGIYLGGYYAACNYNQITNCSIYNNSYGIYLEYSSNNIITNTPVYNNSDGIYLSSFSNSNTITNCSVYSNSGDGIRLASSSNNDITSSQIHDNHYGIYLWDSSNNNITDCNVYSNQYGIYLFSSLYNQITYCDIINNTNDGIYLYYWVGFLSNNNIFHHNNFIGNGQDACDPYTNSWDNSIGEGNYWGDYTGSDADNNWIGDAVYSISGGSNKDNYPLMYPYPAGNPNKPKGYSSIQDAIDDANMGDTIYVWNGTYHENIIINKTISLVGRDRNTAIIDGSGTGYVIYISADWVNMSMFGVRNGTGGFGLYSSSNNTITNCTVYDNYDDGIILDQSSNSSISNCAIYKNSDGIVLYYSSNNDITNCTVYNNSYGICMHSSSNNKLRNIVLEDNTYNFGVLGENISYYYHDIDVSNTINGKPIYYIKEQSSLVFDATMSIGYLGLVSCNNIKIENITVTNNIQGFLLANTSYSTISNCTVHTNYYYGIRLYSSPNNIITNCIVYNNSKGISPDYASNNNTISNCAVYNNTYAVWLYESSNNNIITNCDVYNNSFGIMLSYSSNNTIANCTIYNNSYESIRLEYYSSNNDITNCTVYSNYWGVYLYSSSNNLIYNNYFNNTNNVGIYEGSNNKWNISKTAGTNIIGGSYLGGNYWSDYTGYDVDGDGLGDTPYTIPSGTGEMDYLPLVRPRTPIYINGNDQFTSANGVTSGNGTAGNPYIIENYNINASTANGIDFRNTDKYFIIRNCIIHDGKTNYNFGIHFYSVTNGKIENCTIYNNSFGIYLYSSSNSNIINCSVYDNPCGIYLNSSSNNTLINCALYNNYGDGIYLYYSSNNNIINCACLQQFYGISLEVSSNNQITNCTVYNSYDKGIWLYYSSNNQIHYCNIYNNSFCGVYNYNVGSQYSVNATYTWWGSANGPGQDGANPVYGAVIYDPWLIEPYHSPLIIIIQPEEGLITNQDVSLEYMIDVPLTSTGNPIAVNIDGPPNGTIYSSEGEYNITIIVTDGAGNTATTTISFTIDKTDPTITVTGVADSAHYNVNVTPVITMDEAGILEITLNDVYFESGTEISVDGVYYLNVTGVDLAGNTATKNVVFTVDKTPPVANAGLDREINEDEGLELNASLAWDNMGITNWTWSFVEQGKEVFLYGEIVYYTFIQPGYYVITLNVSDLAGNRALDIVNVTVKDITLPIANAGNDVIVNEDVEVELNASLSWDNVGIINWTWSLIDQGKEVFLYDEIVYYIFVQQGIYQIVLNVSDAAGGWAIDFVNITVKDATLPTISNIQSTPNVQEVYGYVNITCTVTDNVGVNIVKLNISDVGNFTMNYDTTTGLYYYNTSYSATGAYSFTIWANDTSNNSNLSIVNQFTIQDTTKPGISNVQVNPLSQLLGGYVNITCTVTDNVAVNAVKVNIWGPADFISVNTTMIGITGTDNYYYNVSYSIIGTYSYYVWTDDMSNNQNKSLTYQFTIQDTTKPEIKTISIEVSQISQLQNGYANITCTITDNVAVGNVKVNITGPAGFIPINATMTRIAGTDNYYYNITFAIAGEYSYCIWTNDTSGNDILSAPYQFVITIAYRETIEGREVGVVGISAGTITLESAVLPQQPPENLHHIGIQINVTITGALIYANITIKYNDSDVANIDESKLKMYYWDGKQWQLCNNSGVDTVNNIIWANITHLTIFAPMAEKVAEAPAPVNLFLYAGITGIVMIILAAAFIVVLKKRKKSKEA